MNTDDLKRLREAVLNMSKPEHTFDISGVWFKCKWVRDHFEWTAPSGCVYRMKADEVIECIGDGSAIDRVLYDYTDDGIVEDDDEWF